MRVAHGQAVLGANGAGPIRRACRWPGCRAPAGRRCRRAREIGAQAGRRDAQRDVVAVPKVEAREERSGYAVHCQRRRCAGDRYGRVSVQPCSQTAERHLEGGGVGTVSDEAVGGIVSDDVGRAGCPHSQGCVSGPAAVLDGSACAGAQDFEPCHASIVAHFGRWSLRSIDADSCAVRSRNGSAVVVRGVDRIALQPAQAAARSVDGFRCRHDGCGGVVGAVRAGVRDRGSVGRGHGAARGCARVRRRGSSGREQARAGRVGLGADAGVAARRDPGEHRAGRLAHGGRGSGAARGGCGRQRPRIGCGRGVDA